ncbi:MAG: DUF3810 domain-containing protein [Oscillospiraceae bacterium]|nr:DUF3810 domain-containing protein [Oscillospiraceae bacterium]
MAKTVLRLTLSGILLLVTALAVVAAKYFGAFFFDFYPAFSRWVTAVLAGATSIVPFALCEILLCALLLWFIISLIRAIVKKRMVRWLTGVVLSVCILLTSFVGIWGLNYYAPPMRERLGLSDRQFTVAELKEATIYYRDRAGALADKVMRDETGVMVEYDFDDLAKAAGEGYETLSQTIEDFDGSTVRVKKLLSSPLQGKLNTTGVFICLTGESCVSTTTHSASMPYTMCHEIGHRMAFAREDEANFAAFLACSANMRPEFQYSGCYAAFRYCYAALAQQDPAAAQEVWSGVYGAVARDWADSVEHYKALEDETAAELSDTVYDAYLKSFSVESGVQSYGEVTDLLLVWYFERLK